MAALLERMTRRENASQNEAANPERPKPHYHEKLGGKLFEKMKKFTGGEEEWIEWSDEFRMIIDMKSPKLAYIMKHVENHGEKAVEKAVREMVDLEERQSW